MHLNMHIDPKEQRNGRAGDQKVGKVGDEVLHSWMIEVLRKLD